MILFTVPKIYLKVGNSKYGKCSRGILIRLERISGEFEKIRSFLLICQSEHTIPINLFERQNVKLVCLSPFPRFPLLSLRNGLLLQNEIFCLKFTLMFPLPASLPLGFQIDKETSKNPRTRHLGRIFNIKAMNNSLNNEWLLIYLKLIVSFFIFYLVSSLHMWLRCLLWRISCEPLDLFDGPGAVPKIYHLSYQ